jgi:hypothetical protein
MKLITVFEHEELVALQSAVVVEMWRKVMGTGVGRRKYEAEFTQDERLRIEEYYKIFYKWHFAKVGGTGIPQTHIMSIKTYKFMQRVCHFFGTY